MKLHISDNLALPLDAATMTTCIVGIRGSGKSTTACDLAEEMIKAKQQVVIFDPTDSWLGLRTAKNGEDEGLPITIFGGRRADAPLESGAGELLADLVVDDRLSCIFSMRHFSNLDRARFTIDFARRLFHKNQDPVHLIFDEAQLYAPQNLDEKNTRQQEMLGWMKRLWMQGRTSGISGTLVCQRPATLNKNLMTQCEMLIAMRTIGLQDRDAIEAWVKGWAKTKEEHQQTMEMLATFHTGQGLVWWPGHIYKVVTFREPDTFDSRRTPKPGERKVEPKVLAKVDLEALTKKMQATIERAKQDDPRELRAEIARLKREFDDKPKAAVDDAVLSQTRYQRDAFKDQAENLTTLLNQERAFTRRLHDAIAPVAELFPKLHDRVHIHDALAVVVEQPRNNFRNNSHPETPKSVVTPHPVSGISTPKSESNSDLGKCERAILTVLAQHNQGCTINKLALLGGYRVSGGFRNSLSTLRTAGYIEGENTSTMRITEAGIAALGAFDPLPVGARLGDYWLSHSSFGLCEKQCLRALLENPRGLTIDQLAAATNYQVSGGFRNALSTLRTAGVLVGKNTEVMRASVELFG